MTMTTAEGDAIAPATAGRSSAPWLRTAIRVLFHLAVAYLLILAVHAFLGQWTPEYLQGRDLWHFWFSRMIVPMVMLGVLASVAPHSSVRHHAGGGAAFRRHAFRRSSASRRASPSRSAISSSRASRVHLFQYVQWYHWLIGAAILPATAFYLTQPALPLVEPAAGAGLRGASLDLSLRVGRRNGSTTNSWWIGVENLTFSQAESERMNGLAHALVFLDRGPSPQDLHRGRGEAGDWKR